MNHLKAFSFVRNSAGPLAFFILLSFSLASLAYGQTERVLHSFGANGGLGDGALIQAGLTPDGHGNFFGVTYSGGAYGTGTVYELSPPVQGLTAWTETIIHSFQPYVKD